MTEEPVGAMGAIRVVMVDDEPDFREPVCRFLRRRGMAVHGLGSVEALDAYLDDNAVDVILLDVGLPGEDGLSAVKRLRERTAAGLVMLTAQGDSDSRVRGRLDGADSYLSKPVDLRELEAVIHGLMRRVGRPEAPATAEAWTVDAATWRLEPPAGEGVTLSAAQWAVVDLLTRAPGAAIDRDTLLAAMGLKPRIPEDRRLDVLMSRLRRKLEACAGGGGSPIRTVRNVGYVFTAPVRRATPAQPPG